MMSPFLNRILLGALLLLTLCSGCKPPTPRYGIEGEVTLDGKPLDQTTILLVPRSPDAQRVSGTIERGRFAIPSEVGAVAGEFDVLFSSMQPDFEEARHAHTKLGKAGAKLPQRYAKPSGLTVRIPNDSKPLRFDLNSRPKP